MNGVIRKATDLLLTNIHIHGTQEEIVAYLADEKNADTVLENLQELAKRVDDYHDALQA